MEAKEQPRVHEMVKSSENPAKSIGNLHKGNNTIIRASDINPKLISPISKLNSMLNSTLKKQKCNFIEENNVGVEHFNFSAFNEASKIFYNHSEPMDNKACINFKHDFIHISSQLEVDRNTTNMVDGRVIDKITPVEANRCSNETSKCWNFNKTTLILNKLKNSNFSNESMIISFKIVELQHANKPFKSPVKDKIVNLRTSSVQTISLRKPSIVTETTPENPFKKLELSKIENNRIIKDINQDKDKGDMMSYKSKRKSSILAEIRIKKAIENEKELFKNEKTVIIENNLNSMFCGIPKNKKTLNSVEFTNSCISDILKPKNTNSPLKKPFVLQEKTNSPSKLEIFKINDKENTIFNSKFFLNDLQFEEEKKEQNNELAEMDKAKERAQHREYLKAKEANTKDNEGYQTIVVKKKSVIDLFNCPKTFYRKGDRTRKVYFDLEAVGGPHNNSTDFQPILSSISSEPAFEWNSEKQVIEVIKRVDLYTNYSAEEFIFKKIDKIFQ